MTASTRYANKPGSCTVTVATNGGVELVRVTSADLELTFLPQFGARLISLVSDRQEYLWRRSSLLDEHLIVRTPLQLWPRDGKNLNTWANPGGSKTWPAPQGRQPDQWSGPPDPIIDSGVWTYRAAVTDDGDAELVMTSDHDAATGLTVIRRFSIPGAGPRFTQTLTFINTSSVSRRWSIWEVCQVDATAAGGMGGLVEVDVDDHANVVDLGTYFGDLPVVVARPGVLSLTISAAIAKRGFPGASGRIAFVSEAGRRLTLEFEIDQTALYPDQGSRAEVWVQSAGAPVIAELDGFAADESYVELEVLGPLCEIAPGERVTLEIRWSVESLR